MKRYILDSNAVNQFIERGPAFQRRVIAARQLGCRIGTCEPVVAELYFGLEFSSSKATNLIRLQDGLRKLRSWPFDRAAAWQYGRIAADLKRVGRPMQIIDMMLAAIAASIGNIIVVSSDTDLLAVPGLAVENWAAEQ